MSTLTMEIIYMSIDTVFLYNVSLSKHNQMYKNVKKLNLYSKIWIPIHKKEKASFPAFISMEKTGQKTREF